MEERERSDVQQGAAEACVRALVSGRVQGVAFRHYAREEARRLGVRGWVRNLDDGRVEAWVEGSPEAVDAMVAWLREGPRMARVERVEVDAREPEGHADFGVERSRRGGSR